MVPFWTSAERKPNFQVMVALSLAQAHLIKEESEVFVYFDRSTKVTTHIFGRTGWQFCYAMVTLGIDKVALRIDKL